LGYANTKNFRVLSFSLGAAVLDSEFRADLESGLRIEQSAAGHIESSVLKSTDFSRIQGFRDAGFQQDFNRISHTVQQDFRISAGFQITRLRLYVPRSPAISKMGHPAEVL
jgi:hypothetical protein